MKNFYVIFVSLLALSGCIEACRRYCLRNDALDNLVERRNARRRAAQANFFGGLPFAIESVPQNNPPGPSFSWPLNPPVSNPQPNPVAPQNPAVSNFDVNTLLQGLINQIPQIPNIPPIPNIPSIPQTPSLPTSK